MDTWMYACRKNAHYQCCIHWNMSVYMHACMYRKDVHNRAACNQVTSTFIMRLRTESLLTLCSRIFCVLPVLCSPPWSTGSEGWLPFLLEGPLCGQDQGLEPAPELQANTISSKTATPHKIHGIVRKSPGLEEVGFPGALEDKILFQTL